MPKHKFNNNIILAAFLILLILIILIYSLIMFYDKQKKSNLEDDFSLLNQQIVLDDLYNDYLMDANSADEKCVILTNQIISENAISQQLFDKLRSINKNAIVETDNKLKYMYVLNNIKLWLHNKRINRDCNINNKSILYFYPELTGYSSEKAKIDAKTIIFEHKLSKFAKDYNYLSFALPYVDYIPIINQIIKDYNVLYSPAVIINNKVYYDIPKDINNEFLSELYN